MRLEGRMLLNMVGVAKGVPIQKKGNGGLG